MFLLLLLLLLLLTLGVLESFFHLKHLHTISIRIHVNGIRGKSSVTRLIAAGLRESGIATLAKTTGTEARLIFEDGSEKKYRRKFFAGPASISEQKRLINIANKRKVQALVTECMAVQPEIQEIAEDFFIQSHIGVITNVRLDHTDVMGENYEEIAKNLALTTPYKGTLVLGHEFNLYPELQKVFAESALSRKSKLIQVTQSIDNEENPEQVKYNNTVFEGQRSDEKFILEENKKIALAVCQTLNIPKEIALNGMEKALVDPGSFKRMRVEFEGVNFYFFDAFSANDPESTLSLWKENMPFYGLEKSPILGIFVNRADRGFRIPLFTKHFLPYLKNKETETEDMQAIVVLGEGLFSCKHAFSTLGYRVFLPFFLGFGSVKSLLHKLKNEFHEEEHIILFGFGNSKGMGNKISAWFQENEMKNVSEA